MGGEYKIVIVMGDYKLFLSREGKVTYCEQPFKNDDEDFKCSTPLPKGVLPSAQIEYIYRFGNSKICFFWTKRGQLYSGLFFKPEKNRATYFDWRRYRNKHIQRAEFADIFLCLRVKYLSHRTRSSKVERQQPQYNSAAHGVASIRRHCKQDIPSCRSI